jgi:hypothetical protein
LPFPRALGVEGAGAVVGAGAVGTVAAVPFAGVVVAGPALTLGPPPERDEMKFAASTMRIDAMPAST